MLKVIECRFTSQSVSSCKTRFFVNFQCSSPKQNEDAFFLNPLQLLSRDLDDLTFKTTNFYAWSKRTQAESGSTANWCEIHKLGQNVSFSFRVNFERTSVILSFDFPVYSNKMLLYANFAAEEGMIHLPVGTDKSDPVKYLRQMKQKNLRFGILFTSAPVTTSHWERSNNGQRTWDFIKIEIDSPNLGVFLQNCTAINAFFAIWKLDVTVRSERRVKIPL